MGDRHEIREIQVQKRCEDANSLRKAPHEGLPKSRGQRRSF